MTVVKRPYFAHAVNSYDTPLEHSMLSSIAHSLGIKEEDIENPNQPHHQIGYAKYAERAKAADTKHKGMSYFFDEVLPLCDGCVAWPFLDGRMGLGVAGEAKWAVEHGLPVFLVVRHQLYAEAELPSIEELRAFEEDWHKSPFAIRPIHDTERAQLLASDPSLVVPHIETRLRTYFVYGKEQRPYEEAHLAQMPLPEGFYP